MPSNGSSQYRTTQHRKSHITEGNQSQCNHHIHHNNAEGKQQRERQVWPKTEPNKSPNQHHHPIVSQIKQARALTNRTKQNTNHRAIGKLGTGQTGKRANHNTNHSTHSINTIRGTTEITKITEITRASTGSEKHKGSVTHRSEQKRNRNQRVKAKSARANRAKGEIGTGSKPNQPTQATRSEVKGKKPTSLKLEIGDRKRRWEEEDAGAGRVNPCREEPNRFNRNQLENWILGVSEPKGRKPKKTKGEGFRFSGSRHTKNQKQENQFCKTGKPI